MLKKKMPTEKELKYFKGNPGNRKKPVYKYAYDEKYGCPRRVLNGYTDIQEFIQMSADDVDFSAIGKMLVDTKKNVVDHFTTKDGKVLDLTGQPRNIHEYAAMHNKLTESYNALPDDIRGLFGSFDSFRAAYINGSMKNVLTTYVESKKVNPEMVEGDVK